MKATNPEYLGEESGYLPPDDTLQGPTYFSDAYTANRFHCVGTTMELTIKVISHLQSRPTQLWTACGNMPAYNICSKTKQVLPLSC